MKHSYLVFYLKLVSHYLLHPLEGIIVSLAWYLLHRLQDIYCIPWKVLLHRLDGIYCIAWIVLTCNDFLIKRINKNLFNFLFLNYVYIVYVMENIKALKVIITELNIIIIYNNS